MIMNTIDHKREFIEDNDYIPDECKDCILEECDGIVKKCAVGEYPKSWIGRYQAA
jgi:hypothetical protein